MDIRNTYYTGIAKVVRVCILISLSMVQSNKPVVSLVFAETDYMYTVHANIKLERVIICINYHVINDCYCYVWHKLSTLQIFE